MGRWVSDLDGPRRVSAHVDPCQPHYTPAKTPNRRTHPPGRVDQTQTTPRRLGRADLPLSARVARRRSELPSPVRSPAPTKTWTGEGHQEGPNTARTPRQPATVHIALASAAVTAAADCRCRPPSAPLPKRRPAPTGTRPSFPGSLFAAAAAPYTPPPCRHSAGARPHQ
eukprot:COSAG01_NODE_5552_length_4186_cov_284.585270_1_plen_169_part_00